MHYSLALILENKEELLENENLLRDEIEKKLLPYCTEIFVTVEYKGCYSNSNTYKREYSCCVKPKFDWYKVGGRWNNLLIVKNNKSSSNIGQINDKQFDVDLNLPVGFKFTNCCLVKDFELSMFEKFHKCEFSDYISSFLNDDWVEKYDYIDEEEFKNKLKEELENNSNNILVIIDFHI